MVAAGKKAALTRATGTYTFDEHLDGKPPHIVELAQSVHEFVMELDPAMEEAPKKFYVAYKISQNIVCMEVQRQRLLLYVKLDPDGIPRFPSIARDVRNIGHYGTGDLEVSVRTADDLKIALEFIEKAYHNIGG